METDSMHSTIARKLQIKKKCTCGVYHCVWEARQLLKAYSGSYLHHEFFKSFDYHLFYKNIRSGRVVVDPCVVGVKAYWYNPDGSIIQYKLDFSDSWFELPV